MFQRLYSQGRAFHPAMKNIGVWHHPLSLNTLQMSYIRSLSWGRHPIAHWDMIWGFVLCGWIRELNHNSNNLIFSPHQVGCDQIWEILWDEHWIFCSGELSISGLFKLHNPTSLALASSHVTIHAWPLRVTAPATRITFRGRLIWVCPKIEHPIPFGSIWWINNHHFPSKKMHFFERILGYSISDTVFQDTPRAQESFDFFSFQL